MERIVHSDHEKWDCVVIGGGIAGLTAAIFLARAGKSVLLVEKAKRLGGRATTEVVNGDYLNLGPHALYSNGISVQILNEIGVEIHGKKFNNRGKMFNDGRLYNLPTSPITLLKSETLSWNGKKELLRFFIQLKGLKTEELQGITLNEWLEKQISDDIARQFLLMICRLATYSNDPELISAGAALRQLKLGKAIYLHNGWQSMIAQLREKAVEAGVKLETASIVEKIEGIFPEMEVQLKNGETFKTMNVLSTASPSVTTSFFKEHIRYERIQFLNKTIPTRAACMDIVLKEVPHSDKISFALSLDQPLYFSNHSNICRLSEHESHDVIHIMKYLRAGHIENEASDRQELEAFMDLIQPGWRNHLVYQRFLPRMIVTQGSIFAEKNGVFGRPSAKVRDIPGLYVAGDWVGHVGMLADASFASAREAADQIIDSGKRK